MPTGDFLDELEEYDRRSASRSGTFKWLETLDDETATKVRATAARVLAGESTWVAFHRLAVDKLGCPVKACSSFRDYFKNDAD